MLREPLAIKLFAGNSIAVDRNPPLLSAASPKDLFFLNSIQEENVDQISCTLSLSSTCTQCTSLGTGTVQGKKRTRESDCDSLFYSPTNMQQQEVVGDIDLNEEQLFCQLVKARHGHPPYGKYESWCDIALWEEIVKELGRHSPHNKPTITDALTVVIKYHKEYKNDPALIQKRLSQSLRPLSSLSGETVEYKNYSQALEEFFKEKARRILPSTSDRRGIREYKERGFGGILALQYGEDLAALGITDDEKAWLLQNYNSDSAGYVSLANHTPETRLNCLRRFLENAHETNVPATSPPVLSLLKE